MNKRLLILFITIVFSIPVTLNAEPYRIGAFFVPKMIIDEQNGLFIDLFKEIMKRADIQHELVMLPPKRVIKHFREGKLDGFFPASDGSAGEESYKTIPFYIKKVVLFSRDDAPFTRIEELHGKRLGLTFGYPYSENSLMNVILDHAPTDIHNMRKLSSGRIDAFICEIRSGIAALKESGAMNISFDRHSPVAYKEIYFAFSKDDRGQFLTLLISKIIEEMIVDGRLSTILEDENIIDPNSRMSYWSR